MNKKKAKIKRYFHCFYYTLFKSDNKNHRLATMGKTKYLLNFIPYKDNFWIGCECGRVFYKDLNSKENQKLYNELIKIKKENYEF